MPKKNFNALLACLVILAAVACGSQKRKEGIAELQRIRGALGDIQIMLSAGVTKDEFSRRLTDTLIKIGDMQESQRVVGEKFAIGSQPVVAETYQHFSRAVQAYKTSKEYFGQKLKFDIVWIDTVKMDEYSDLKKQFPNLDELEVVERSSIDANYVFYRRKDMLQALWKVASEETEAAKKVIDKLEQE